MSDVTSTMTAQASPDDVAALVADALLLDHGWEPRLRGTRMGNDFLHVANRHRIGSLLLKQWRNLGLPADSLTELHRTVTADSVAGLTLMKNSVTVAKLFKTHGFRFLIFKGVTLSLLSGRESAARGAGDIDVLVEESEVPRAHRMLVEEGFTPKIAFEPKEGGLWKFWSFRERELSYRKEGTYIDLHWRIPKNTSHTASTSDQLDRALDVLCANATVPTLSPGDALVACATHIYLDYCQNLRLISDFVYLSQLPGVSLPSNAPVASHQLAADMAEFIRRLLDPRLVPDILDAPPPIEDNVAYLNRLWTINSRRSLLEAGPRHKGGEALGRLRHWMLYGPGVVELLRFTSWALFAFPDYSPTRRSTSLVKSFLWRTQQVVSGRLPYLLARAKTGSKGVTDAS